jgi:hypothetical protein
MQLVGVEVQRPLPQGAAPHPRIAADGHAGWLFRKSEIVNSLACCIETSVRWFTAKYPLS